jgi:hypothetical protein
MRAFEGLCIDGPNKGKFMCCRRHRWLTRQLPKIQSAHKQAVRPQVLDIEEAVYHWIPSPFATAPELGVWSIQGSSNFTLGHFQKLIELAAR